MKNQENKYEYKEKQSETIKIKGVKVFMITHRGYQEWKNAKKNSPQFDLPKVFGRYQFLFRKGRTEISLVKLGGFDFSKEMNVDTNGYWEIFQLSGSILFEDVQKFKNKKDAINAIEKLFNNQTLWQRIKSYFIAGRKLVKL